MLIQLGLVLSAFAGGNANVDNLNDNGNVNNNNATNAWRGVPITQIKRYETYMNVCILKMTVRSQYPFLMDKQYEVMLLLE